MNHKLRNSVYLLGSFILLLFFQSCNDKDSVNPVDEFTIDQSLSTEESFVAEINLARNALSKGEESWEAYMSEVVEPTLHYIYGNHNYLEEIDQASGTNLYLELKDIFKNGKVQGNGTGYTASIPESDFHLINELSYSEKLASGSKKWTEYFINNDVGGDYHADFTGKLSVSENDEKGNFEVVAPKFANYNTARAVVVAWLHDRGNKSRGHRIILLGKDRKFAGGYVNTDTGGSTARLTYN